MNLRGKFALAEQRIAKVIDDQAEAALVEIRAMAESARRSIGQRVRRRIEQMHKQPRTEKR